MASDHSSGSARKREKRSKRSKKEKKSKKSGRREEKSSRRSKSSKKSGKRSGRGHRKRGKSGGSGRSKKDGKRSKKSGKSRSKRRKSKKGKRSASSSSSSSSSSRMSYSSSSNSSSSSSPSSSSSASAPSASAASSSSSSSSPPPPPPPPQQQQQPKSSPTLQIAAADKPGKGKGKGKGKKGAAGDSESETSAKLTSPKPRSTSKKTATSQPTSNTKTHPPAKPAPAAVATTTTTTTATAAAVAKPTKPKAPRPAPAPRPPPVVAEPEPLSALDAERLANIERNRAMMAGLGLGSGTLLSGLEAGAEKVKRSSGPKKEKEMVPVYFPSTRASGKIEDERSVRLRQRREALEAEDRAYRARLDTMRDEILAKAEVDFASISRAAAKAVVAKPEKGAGARPSFYPLGRWVEAANLSPADPLKALATGSKGVAIKRGNLIGSLSSLVMHPGIAKIVTFYGTGNGFIGAWAVSPDQAMSAPLDPGELLVRKRKASAMARKRASQQGSLSAKKPRSSSSSSSSSSSGSSSGSGSGSGSSSAGSSDDHDGGDDDDEDDNDDDDAEGLVCPGSMGLRRLHEDTVSGLAVDATGSTLLSCSRDGTALAVDLATQEATKLVEGKESLTCLALLDGARRSGNTVVYGSLDGNVFVRDRRERKGRPFCDVGRGVGLMSMSVNMTGETLATSGNDGTVKIWDARNRAVIAEYRHSHSPQPVTSVAYSPTDPKLLVSLSALGTLVFLNPADLSVTIDILPVTIPHPAHSAVIHRHDIHFDPSGTYVSAISSYRALRIVHAYNRKTLEIIPTGKAVIKHAWHPSGLVATAALPRTCTLFKKK